MAETGTVARAVPVAAALDVTAVLVFAAVGRRAHAEGLAVVGVLEVAAPFLVGLLAGWVAGRAWRAPLRMPAGATVWLATAAVGLALRAAVTHRLPVSFVAVATVSLGVFLVGWRAVTLAVLHVRHRTP